MYASSGSCMMNEPFELILLEECSTFLEKFKSIYHNGTKKPLRRGMLLQSDDDIVKVKVNKNRTPMNTHRRIHEAADDWFLERFGVRARSQSVFCTSSTKVANDYGFPFLVFPAGNYEVIWSRKINDLFFVLSEGNILSRIRGEKYMNRDAEPLIDDKNEVSDKELYDAVYTILDESDYVKGHLDQALASKNEIMVHCDHYYVAKHDNPAVLEFMKDYIKGNI